MLLRGDDKAPIVEAGPTIHGARLNRSWSHTVPSQPGANMNISAPPQSTRAHHEPPAAPAGAGSTGPKPQSGSQHVEPPESRYHHGNNTSPASDPQPVAQPPAHDDTDRHKGHKDKDHKGLISDLRKVCVLLPSRDHVYQAKN